MIIESTSPPIAIVDSHIHIFPQTHLSTLAWHTPDNPLGTQHSVDQYRSAALSAPTESSSSPSSTFLRGFIFVETDRLSSVDESESPGWKHVLDEVAFLVRVARGAPLPGEGHRPEDKGLCVGIVPWAPVPAGPETLERYMGLVKERTEIDEVWRKDRFIQGLKWLWKKGLTFDLGVDARSGGLWQLREAVEMMRKVYEDASDDEGLVIVINHLCKPNLRLPYTSRESITSHPEFIEWSSLIRTMSTCPRTYIKLSGAFSELPSLSPNAEPDIDSLVERLGPWTDTVFEAFGSGRIMFGSDWPVCNVGGGGNAVSWRRWRAIVEGVIQRKGLTREQMRDVWGGVAVKAYGIEL
ncbi:amidohydrolase family protein [Paecilomyces variotii No. 5]|uniref:Amidohydrolase family protein n=1 Tax=Byssochlamys spectabilis (strain No. 5 / NBRC 109023) TaxID=1356009 RepID=V5FH16_BYSSN|nr:amidohydrolase family protein [Paecilomyces variotii No. 5]